MDDMQLMKTILQNCTSDLDKMKAAYPKSKRGSRYIRALENLEDRLNTLAGMMEADRGSGETPDV